MRLAFFSNLKNAMLAKKNFDKFKTQLDVLYVFESSENSGSFGDIYQFEHQNDTYKFLEDYQIEVVLACEWNYRIPIENFKHISFYYPLPTKKNEEERWVCDMIPTWQFRVREGEYTDYIYISAVDNMELVG